MGRAYEEQNLGLSIKLALENLCERIPLLDLRLAVTAIMIQRETGGNLGEILETVAATIRDRFCIMEDLKTLTTSSRLSAWCFCVADNGCVDGNGHQSRLHERALEETPVVIT